MLIFTQNSLANYICISINCKSQSNLLIGIFRIDGQIKYRILIIFTEQNANVISPNVVNAKIEKIKTERYRLRLDGSEGMGRSEE